MSPTAQLFISRQAALAKAVIVVIGIIAITVALPSCDAFAPSALSSASFPTTKVSSSASASLMLLHASSVRNEDDEQEDCNYSGLGATEKLLLEYKKKQDQEVYEKEQGLVQDLGKTIKNDGLDGIRAIIWGIFNVSQNFVFPTLAVLMILGMAVNVAGYAYYFENGKFVIDTIEHIRQEQQFVHMMASSATQDAINNFST